MTAPAIEGAELTRQFGAMTALNEVDITVQQGSVCGLLGRNGAGKTTLMSLITGQDRPTSGTIKVLGHNPYEHDRTVQAISFIRDNQRYPDDFRLRHALKATRMFRPNWDEALAERLVEVFRLPAKTAIKKYSRGQISSLAIVLGLASRTPITLLDEPYLGLDATARQTFYDVLIEEQMQHPRTFLISTHLVAEMENIFDSVIVLDRGSVVLNATMDDLHGKFVQISGLKARVEEFAAAHRVVSTRTVGSLATALIHNNLDGDARHRATELGLEWERADLQSVVSALGSIPTATEGANNV
ncbi:ABC-2 type transport system ATP-binding protein [Micrococcales bacterium KH10]|nr:ABC-2 type transport system ATP-binding protein [Micrococcales bacterium KH10]